MERIITITGNRNTTPSDISRIAQTINQLFYDDMVSTIYFGGARGTDTHALQAAIMYRHACKRPDVKLICVVPDTLSKQPRETILISNQADQLIELKNEITAKDRYQAYHTRNKYMVDNSSEVIAFWNGEPHSGTYTTIKYAKACQMKVTLVTIEGSDR